MEINITIEGVSPLLMNMFSDAAMAAATNGTSSALRAKDKGTPLEQAALKLYVDQNGRPVIPGPNVFRSILDGGKFHKAGKKQITTQKESMLCACMTVVEYAIPLVHREPWVPDSRAVVNPMTNGRMGCHRPKFNDWQLTFTVELDTDFIDAKLFRAIVDDAGKRIGLGDFRPARKGPFGRYVVTRWTEETALRRVA